MTDSKNCNTYWVVTMMEQPHGHPVHRGELIESPKSKADLIKEYLDNKMLVVNIIDL